MGQLSVNQSVKVQPAPAEDHPTAPAATLPQTLEQRRDELMTKFSGKGLPTERAEREEFSRQLADLSPADRGLVITAAFINKGTALKVRAYSESVGPANKAILAAHDGKPIANLGEIDERPSEEARKKIEDFSRELQKLETPERVAALFSRLHGAKVAEEIYESAKLIGSLGDPKLNDYNTKLASYLAASISARHEDRRTLDGRTILTAAAVLQDVTPSGHTEIVWAVEDATRIRRSYEIADAKSNQDIANRYKHIENRKERFKAVADYYGADIAEYARKYNSRDSIGGKLLSFGTSDSEKYLTKLVKEHPELDPRKIRGAANCLDGGSVPMTDAERTAYAEKVASDRKPKEQVFGTVVNPQSFEMTYRLEALQGQHATSMWMKIDGKTESLAFAPIQPYDRRNRVDVPTHNSEDPNLPAATENRVQIAVAGNTAKERTRVRNHDDPQVKTGAEPYSRNRVVSTETRVSSAPENHEKQVVTAEERESKNPKSLPKLQRFARAGRKDSKGGASDLTRRSEPATSPDESPRLATVEPSSATNSTVSTSSENVAAPQVPKSESPVGLTPVAPVYAAPNPVPPFVQTPVLITETRVIRPPTQAAKLPPTPPADASPPVSSFEPVVADALKPSTISPATAVTPLSPPPPHAAASIPPAESPTPSIKPESLPIAGAAPGEFKPEPQKATDSRISDPTPVESPTVAPPAPQPIRRTPGRLREIVFGKSSQN